MRFEYCFFALVAASGTTASGYCGTTGPTVAQQRVARDLHAREVDTQSRGLSMINRTEIEVNAYAYALLNTTLIPYTDPLLSVDTPTSLPQTRPRKGATSLRMRLNANLQSSIKHMNHTRSASR